MRRFIAYISLLICTILGIGLSIKPALNSINPGLDYTYGKEFVYQLTNLGENISDNAEPVTAKTAATEIAEQMDARLKNYGISQYNIEIEGNDTLRVSLFAESDSIYNHVQSYLAFDGRLTLATSDFEYVYQNYTDRNQADKTNTTMFGVTAAYTGYKDIYPATVIPLEDIEGFTKAVDHAKSLNKNTDTSEGADTSTSEEGYFYLWTNWEEGDDFQKADENENIKNKLVMRFDPANLWWEEKEADHKSICALYSVSGSENAATSLDELKVSNIRDANENAKYFTALLNTSQMDYKVNFIYSTVMNPVIENAINLGSMISPAFSATLIGFTIAYALLIAFAVAIYKLAGLSLSLLNVLGVIITLIAFNSLGGSLTVASVIGFAVLSIVMFISSLIFAQTLKNELKTGKTLKKSNIDALKKSSIFTIDISVLTLIAGACIYLLGGSYLSSLGIVFFFGSFINVVINAIIIRPSMYFLVNSNICLKENGTKFVGYDPVADKKQEELIKESADQGVLNDAENNAVVEPVKAKTSKFSSSMKGSLLVGLGVVATLTAILVTSIVATPYSEDKIYDNSNKIYIRVEDKKTAFKDSGAIEEILTYVTESEVTLTEEEKADPEKEAAAYKKSSLYASIDSKTFSDTTNPKNSGDAIKHDYLLYVVYLKETTHTTAKTVYFKNVETGLSLEEFVSNKILTVDPDATVGLKNSSQFALTEQYHFQEIALSLSISIIIVTIYLALRYKASQAIATGMLAIASTIISLGLFAILRTPVNAYVTIATITTMMIALIYGLIYMYRYKDDVKDIKNVDGMDKTAQRELLDISLENSRELNFGCLAICSLTFISLLFGVAPLLSNLYLTSIVYVMVAYGIIMFVLVPLSVQLKRFGYYLSNNIKMPTNKKGKLKREHKQRRVSKEAEEATFIGIND